MPTSDSGDTNVEGRPTSSSSSRSWWRRLGLVMLTAALIPPIVMLASRQRDEPSDADRADRSTAPAKKTIAAPGGARLVGSKSCAECHEAEVKAWLGSDHDLAMQRASDETVRADFNNTTFSRRGKTSRFFRRDGRFFVHTEGRDGRPADFEVKYTFGVRPLQQYMVQFPDGRVQVLTTAWDTERKRWFYQYPGHTEVEEQLLHWTGPLQNWNFMCAECHSTGVQKNYDLATNSYKTTWNEIDVNCEACHGPASHHLRWAEAKQRHRTPPPWAHAGFAFTMADHDGASWPIDPKTGIAKRSKPRRSRAEVELCGRCHSRRSVIEERYEFGEPLANTHRPALLGSLLYHADGQIDDEVFVYGSFLQSKMYRAGVSCGDCHDPHSLQLRGAADQVCARCHLHSKFSVPEHHFHKANSPGASCIGCHLPKKRYMVVDPRGDHSFRIPRPDLSLALGTPNACSNQGCHADKPVEWSADAARKWYGPELARKPHYGQVLHAARRGDPGAFAALSQLIADGEMPGIVRATAVSLLGGYSGFPIAGLVRSALADDDALVRRAAVAVAALFPPEARIGLAVPLLRDPVRNVRVEAAYALASLPTNSQSSVAREILGPALAEYERVQQINGDRGESHVNRAVLLLQRGDVAAAERAYRTALRIHPEFLAAYINLADLYRGQGQDARGAELLQRALTINPDNADVHHAMGLLHTRQKRTAEALAAFRRATELDPDSPRHAYVYGVALHSTGRSEQAIAVLRAALERHPFDRELLLAITTMQRDVGRYARALAYGQRLAALAPGNPTFEGLLQQLRSHAPR